MKELIKKFEKESGLEIYGLGARREKWEAVLEKFAELIVQECAKVVGDMADPEDSERYFWAIQNASQKIKEHFGVEE